MALNLSTDVTDSADLKCWQDELESPSSSSSEGSTRSLEERSPFPVDEALNRKICLWKSSHTNSLKLKADGITFTGLEDYQQDGGLYLNLVKAGGPQFQMDLRAVSRKCRTGDVRCIEGYNLPARYVIYTVGPRFNSKYETAAASALFNCYRGCLGEMKELGLRTLGLGCLHTMKRGYAAKPGAHIACRTVRRFLEEFPDSTDRIVFCVNDEEYQVYKDLLKLYFPRDKLEEMNGKANLPEDIGNEIGEPVVEDRQIRLGAGTIGNKDEIDLEVGEEEEQFAAFAAMQDDVDKRVINGGAKTKHAEEAEQLRRYKNLLAIAKSEDLSEIAQLKMIYIAGKDRHSRSIVVFVGKNFPARSLKDKTKAIRYCINMMDRVVNSEYIIVYLHTQTTSANRPEMSFMKELHASVDQRYKKNLKNVYVVHPTFWTKVVTWFFATFTVSDIKSKIVNIEKLEYLYDVIDPSEIELPSFVVQKDNPQQQPISDANL